MMDNSNFFDSYFMRKCIELGLYHPDDSCRDYNVGESDYSKHFIQPWTIIQEYNLNYWDGDIIKRILRTKENESREKDYKKIIHICQERLRQLKYEKSSSGINNNQGT